MMMSSLISAVVLLVTAAPAAEKGSSVFDSSVAASPATEIDKHVLAKLSSLKIRPVLCSDAVFVRRVYLDVIGVPPTAKEAKDFIRDPDTKNKRRLLIDRLLERDEFADYWAMKWGDILRIKAEFPVNLWPNAAQAYHRWVRASIAENKPYDKFARELLTSSGSNFRVGPVNFYRAVQSRTPEGIAAAVALTLMGARYESWPKARQDGMAVFFSQVGYKPTSEWKEENVFWDPLRASFIPGNAAPGRDAIAVTKKAPSDASQPAAEEGETASPPGPPPLAAVFPDGTKVRLSPNRDPRDVFADWLIDGKTPPQNRQGKPGRFRDSEPQAGSGSGPNNPWFARCIVNRVWAWLLGRGIIHEPDDIRDDNPPSNPALLSYLEKEMIAGRYDLKRLYRLILNSNTYQFSSVPRYKGKEAEANFASYPLRRLEAEVLIDAINKITGASDLYTSAIPEPFTYIPQDKPAVALADGSITSPFLTLFGRSARATGMENERSNKPVSSQWLHMLNSSHIQRKLEQGPKLRAIIETWRKREETVEELYLTVFSRFPTAEEVSNALAYGSLSTTLKPGKSGKIDKSAWAKRRDDWIDITWSLLNSPEFLYRH